ncbi:MAG: phosphate signaling complex protein PhoU [Candidatus Aminicenantes bacterium]|nr:phosphate signaling complex protein PhoU [Candidatus Aminicenantes bacterium]
MRIEELPNKSEREEKVLEKELISLKKKIVEYAALVENMIQNSIQGLLDKNEPQLNDVIEVQEPKANDLELRIEEQATVTMAKFQPTAKDLRVILMILRMNNDLERMADHAVNVAERSLFLIKNPMVKPLIDIPKSAEITIQMLKDSVDAFIKEDAELAKNVCERDNKIDNLNNQILRELITYMFSDPSTIERSIKLLQISNNFERIADLSTNISEDVIYIVEGRVIKHQRDQE